MLEKGRVSPAMMSTYRMAFRTLMELRPVATSDLPDDEDDLLSPTERP